MNSKVLGIILVIIVILVVIVLATTGGEEAPDDGQSADNGQDTTEQPGDQPSGDEAPDTDDTPSTDTDDADTDADAEVNTVSYSSNGFEPSRVTISVGSTVTFTNDSGDGMWVASAVHPTHKVYQGTALGEHCSDGVGPDAFDQCETGGSYSFTFDKAGEWGYHNHVNAAHTGVVVVTE